MQGFEEFEKFWAFEGFDRPQAAGPKPHAQL
jgi:hypothetical protein